MKNENGKNHHIRFTVPDGAGGLREVARLMFEQAERELERDPKYLTFSFSSQHGPRHH